MRSNLITKSELLREAQKVEQVLSTIESHVERDHSRVHMGFSIIQPATTELYRDSAGQTWPGDTASGRIGVIEVGGVKYYFPAKTI
jgi:hypothetical protein